jgi:hypothetical protein
VSLHSSLTLTFEIFPSGKGWYLLFGKPLLQKFEAVRSYTQDTLHIPLNNSSWATLSNQCGETCESAENSRGIEIPPSKQVQPNLFTYGEQIDEQNTAEFYMPVEKHAYQVAAGAGLMWRHEQHKETEDDDDSPVGEIVQTLNGGTDIPPTGQAQSSNCYSALALLGDTVLEDELNHRNYTAAYQDPKLLGYRVPGFALSMNGRTRHTYQAGRIEVATTTRTDNVEGH